MKFLYFCLLTLLISSCSSHKMPSQDEVGKGVPKWVYAPDEGCSKLSAICASGSGESMEEADVNAKKSLASIFETKITSNFEVQTTSFSDSQKEEMAEKVYSEVEENIDVILKAVEIKKRFIKDDNFFALAVLDKRKASKTLRLEIKNIDDKLDYLFKQNKRTNIKQMLFLFDKRQLLHERLILMDKNIMPSKYSFQQISNLRHNSKNSLIKIEYDDNIDTAVQKWFDDLLNDFGYKITTGDNVSYKLKISKNVSEQYLKVKGFKKFKYTLSAEALNQAEEKIGTLSVSLLSNGRDENDAFQKIRMKLRDEVENNLYKLNME